MLVALCAQAGRRSSHAGIALAVNENQAAYIQSRLQRIKEDKKLLVTASPAVGGLDIGSLAGTEAGRRGERPPEVTASSGAAAEPETSSSRP